MAASHHAVDFIMVISEWQRKNPEIIFLFVNDVAFGAFCFVGEVPLKNLNKEEYIEKHSDSFILFCDMNINYIISHLRDFWVDFM